MANGAIGRKELLIGGGVVLVLALATIPFMTGPSTEGLRNEVPQYVNALRDKELQLHKALGEDFRAAAWAPRDPAKLSGEPVAWEGNRDFVKIGWEPADTAKVYGTYTVTVADGGFIVKGSCDLDGDGRRATWVATQDEPAKRTSDPDVY